MAETDIFAFGHFFGFTAAANYAPALLSQGLDTILDSIKKRDFTVLYSEKENPERKLNDCMTLLEKWDKITDPAKRAKTRNLCVEGQKIKLEFTELKAKVDGYLDFDKEDGVTLDESFIKRFEYQLKPLFPLAGTFSVIILLIAAFDEFLKSFELIHLNTYCGVCISTIILLVLHIKFSDFSVVSNSKMQNLVSKRNIQLNIALVLLALVSLPIGIFFAQHPIPTTLSLTRWKIVLLILTSLIISGLPFLAVIYKNLLLNRASKKHSGQLNEINSRINSFLEKALS